MNRLTHQALLTAVEHLTQEDTETFMEQLTMKFANPSKYGLSKSFTERILSNIWKDIWCVCIGLKFSSNWKRCVYAKTPEDLIVKLSQNKEVRQFFIDIFPKMEQDMGILIQSNFKNSNICMLCNVNIPDKGIDNPCNHLLRSRHNYELSTYLTFEKFTDDNWIIYLTNLLKYPVVFVFYIDKNIPYADII